jgi:hypothetical protein
VARLTCHHHEETTECPKRDGGGEHAHAPGFRPPQHQRLYYILEAAAGNQCGPGRVIPHCANCEVMSEYSMTMVPITTRVYRVIKTNGRLISTRVNPKRLFPGSLG